MAKGTKNSGKFQQDAVVGRFMADAKKPQTLNAVVKAAMAQQSETESIAKHKKLKLS